MQSYNNEITTLKPMSVWDILDTTFSIYRRHLLLYLSIVAIFFLSNLIDYSIKGFLSDNNLKQLVASLVSLPFAILSMGGIVVATAAIYLGEEITTINALKQSLHKLWTLIKAHILWRMAQVIPLIFIFLSITSIFRTGTWALVVLSAIICLPILVYFTVRWIFHFEVVIVENTRAIGALQRSSDLVRDNWWSVFGAIILISLASHAIQYIFEFSVGAMFILLDFAGGTDLRAIFEWSILQNVLDSNNFVFYITMISSKLILNSLIIPIWVIGVVLLYFDRKIRKEGYDLERNATVGTDLS